MKLKLKELQALDAMLHAYSLSKNYAYRLIFKIDSKLVTGKFLNFVDEYNFPVEFECSFNGEKRPKSIDNSETYLFKNCTDKLFRRMNNHYDSLNRVMKNTDFLLDELLRIINDTEFNESTQYESNKIYDLKFLESDIQFDFYIIDPHEEYELVSLILESKN